MQMVPPTAEQTAKGSIGRRMRREKRHHWALLWQQFCPPFEGSTLPPKRSLTGSESTPHQSTPLYASRYIISTIYIVRRTVLLLACAKQGVRWGNSDLKGHRWGVRKDSVPPPTLDPIKTPT